MPELLELDEEAVHDDWNADKLLAPYADMLAAAEIGGLRDAMDAIGMPFVQLANHIKASSPDYCALMCAEDIRRICAHPLRREMQMWQGVVRCRLQELEWMHEALWV